MRTTRALRPREAAALLGTNLAGLERLHAEGKLPPRHTLDGEPVYFEHELAPLLYSPARVCSY